MKREADLIDVWFDSGCHAVCADPLSVREQGTAGQPPGLPRRLSSPKVWTRLAAGSLRCMPSPQWCSTAISYKAVISNGSGTRQERQQDVQASGQWRRPVLYHREIRVRPLALVHDHQFFSVGQPEVRRRRQWKRCAANSSVPCIIRILSSPSTPTWTDSNTRKPTCRWRNARKSTAGLLSVLNTLVKDVDNLLQRIRADQRPDV